MSEIEKLRAEMAEDRKARAEEKAAAEAEAKTKAFVESWEGAKRRLQTENGYTAEGIAAIEKLAQERGIADIDAAAALFDRLNPPPEPVSSPGMGSWGFFEPGSTETDYVSKMMQSKGTDEVALRNEVASALAEVRGGRR